MFCIFLKSTHQVGMKTVVECKREFFAYFNALETRGERIRSAQVLLFKIIWLEFQRRLVWINLSHFFQKYTYTYFCFLELPDEGPVITGGLPNYQLNDQLTLNCTSPRTFPPTLLKWKINKKAVNFCCCFSNDFLLMICQII